MKPLFSVIISTYNRANFINISIDSVLEQTYSDFELIVIDDFSNDRTIAKMSEYTGRGINYIRISHKGVSGARNEGIKIARGKYIAFLDSDDKWDNEKLSKTAEYISKFPDINIFHTDEIWFKNGKILNQKEIHKRPSGYVYPDCLSLCCIGMSTSLVKKSLFREIGLFDENLPACEDYDLWLRACYSYEVKLIPFPLTIKYGGRKDQLSNQPGLDKYRVYALEKMLKSGVLDKKQHKITVNQLINKCKIYANGALKRGKNKEAQKYYKLIEKYKS